MWEEPCDAQSAGRRPSLSMFGRVELEAGLGGVLFDYAFGTGVVARLRGVRLSANEHRTVAGTSFRDSGHGTRRPCSCLEGSLRG